MKTRMLVAAAAALMSGVTFTDPAMAGANRGHVKQDDDLNGFGNKNAMTSASDGLGSSGAGGFASMSVSSTDQQHAKQKTAGTLGDALGLTNATTLIADGASAAPA